MDWKITLTEMPLNGVGEIRTETMTLHNVDMLGARRIAKMNCKQRGFTCFNMVEVGKEEGEHINMQILEQWLVLQAKVMRF